jgi:hypothetical protein
VTAATPPHTAQLTADDHALLSQAIDLLDHVARRSDRCAVSLHAASAAQLLATVHPSSAAALRSPIAVDGNRASLHRSLRILAQVSDGALRIDPVADALHHAFLAHLAAR